MSKYDFNKVALQCNFIESHLDMGVISCKFTAYFQNIFSLERLWKGASVTTLSLL